MALSCDLRLFLASALFLSVGSTLPPAAAPCRSAGGFTRHPKGCHHAAPALRLRGGVTVEEVCRIVEEEPEPNEEEKARMEGLQRRRALWFAAEEGDIAVIEEEAAAGVDVNSAVHSKDNGGCPIHWAAKAGQLASIQKLLELGADVNRRNSDNQTALHWAAIKGMVDACKVLLDNGADVNAADTCGWTPLHAAAYWGRGETVDSLLQLGSDARAVDAEGDTPLHNAAYKGYLEIARTLAQHGADLKAWNKQERTPADVAEWCEHSEVAGLLASLADSK